MPKITKEEQARREGMEYAYRFAKENGLDSLKEEIEYRRITNCPVGIERSQAEQFVESVKNNVIDTMLIMSATVLQDEFDFGKKRIGRFVERFNLKASCISDGYASWKDFQDQLQRELGMVLTIRENKEDIIIIR